MKINMIETMKAADSTKPFGPWVKRVKTVEIGPGTAMEVLADLEHVYSHEEAVKIMAYNGWKKFTYNNPDGTPYYVYYQATTFDTDEGRTPCPAGA